MLHSTIKILNYVVIRIYFKAHTYHHLQPNFNILNFKISSRVFEFSREKRFYRAGGCCRHNQLFKIVFTGVTLIELSISYKTLKIGIFYELRRG